ncbi:hypothetical protein CLOM_g24234 [Closterium sp. NIES-68]|nr:hypothetical protein CLOM_g24234 [Closterium sp. NIES-68]GJP85519.1 hypothetical protein CLOP_g15609 [Closterium sp. NIES-67]
MADVAVAGSHCAPSQRSWARRRQQHLVAASPRFLLRRSLPSLLLPLLLSALYSHGPPQISAKGRPQGDQCAALAAALAASARVVPGTVGVGFATPSQTKHCLRSFRFVASRDIPVIDSIINGLANFYVYRHIAIESPDARLPSDVDIVTYLRAIREKALRGKGIKSLMRFQTLIYRALMSLNDGHTMFSSNCFHRTASYYLPLPLVAVVEDGRQIIRVAPSSLLLQGLDVAALVLHQFDYYRYEGAQVLTINAVPAMDYLLAWAARYVGQYRDSGVRFNLLFARRVVSKATGEVISTQGAFAQRSLAPTNDSVVVELQLATSTSPVTVAVPWVAVLPTNFATTASYWTANCAKPRQATAAAAAASAAGISAAAASSAAASSAAASSAAASSAAASSAAASAAAASAAAASSAAASSAAASSAAASSAAASSAAASSAAASSAAASSAAASSAAADDDDWGLRSKAGGEGMAAGTVGPQQAGGPRLKKRAWGVRAWGVRAWGTESTAMEGYRDGNRSRSGVRSMTGGGSSSSSTGTRQPSWGRMGGSRAGMGGSSRERAAGWPTLAVEFPRPDLDALPSLLHPLPRIRAPPLLLRPRQPAASAAAAAADSGTAGIDADGAAAAATAAASEVLALSAAAPNDLAGAQKLSKAAALIPVYLLPDNRTAVIWMHTFLPALDGSDEALIAFLLTEISAAIDLANRYGKRVILDVSGNGGGYADVAYLLLRLVAGKQRAPKGRVQMPQQFLVSSAFMLGLLDRQLASFYQWDKYVKVDEATPMKSATDFKPFQNLQFSSDGQPGVYSGLFKLSTFPGLEKIPFQRPVFGSRPFVIVTNGNCFSACAIFTHNLRKRFGVKHVTVGGVMGQPLGISASCMGATMPSLETGVTNFLTGTKFADHPRAPKPFPYNVVQGVAVVQGFVQEQVPCEYVFLPGDRHVNLTMDKVANPALVWAEASQYF